MSDSTWVYRHTETSPEGSRLYTVGFYDPDGEWHPEGDHDDPGDAARRVHYLNGGATETDAPGEGDPRSAVHTFRRAKDGKCYHCGLERAAEVHAYADPDEDSGEGEELHGTPQERSRVANGLRRSVAELGLGHLDWEDSMVLAAAAIGSLRSRPEPTSKKGCVCGHSVFEHRDTPKARCEECDCEQFEWRPEPTVEGEDPPNDVLAKWLEGEAFFMEHRHKRPERPEVVAKLREAARRLRERPGGERGLYNKLESVMAQTTPHNFLRWLRDRLIHQYGESPNVDFVHTLGRLVEVLEEEVIIHEPTREEG